MPHPLHRSRLGPDRSGAHMQWECINEAVIHVRTCVAVQVKCVCVRACVRACAVHAAGRDLDPKAKKYAAAMLSNTTFAVVLAIIRTHTAMLTATGGHIGN